MWQQLQIHATAVAAGVKEEIVWACEHEPVYTTGRRAIDNRTQPELPAPLIYTDRGGETTFHGPGQIMLYPILHLKQRRLSPRNYVHLLEQSVIDLLAESGIGTKRQCGLPGVWSDDGKIAAIGLRIKNGVAYHGMALNVDVAPDWFAVINPCGTKKRSLSMAFYMDQLPELQWLANRWNEHLTRILCRN
ncbi:MAG: lipoyl(octanoyl) transferase LipB [Mariprofundaceae bacterium]